MSICSKIKKEVLGKLCCPICYSKLELMSSYLKCANPKCKGYFPIVGDIPILINESDSLFSIEDFVQNRSTFFQSVSRRNIVGEVINKLLPEISLNIKARQNYLKFAEFLFKQNKNPLVLIIGGSIVGQGLESIISFPSIQFLEADVSFGPRTGIVFDAHNIPFEDSTFDGVIIQAVLEHVVDPYRVVEEIHRVLKNKGLVYAETPFMQQAHGGKYDFTRFTYLGHRRLFRKFSEIDSGAVCGPGMALAWSYQYFLISFVKSKFATRFIKGFARLTSFWLKYFDYILINNPRALDAASGYYFMGIKCDKILSDKELINLYKGD